MRACSQICGGCLWRHVQRSYGNNNTFEFRADVHVQLSDVSTAKSASPHLPYITVGFKVVDSHSA